MQKIENYMTRLLNYEDGMFERIVNGCILACIKSHGDITKQFAGSATKRICNSIRGALLKDVVVDSDLVNEVVKCQIERLNKDLANSLRRQQGMSKNLAVLIKRLDMVDPTWRNELKNKWNLEDESL